MQSALIHSLSDSQETNKTHLSAKQHDPDQTIAELYRAAAGTVPWAKALQRVVDDLDALGAQMIGVDKRTGAIAFSHIAEDTNAEAALEYVRKYHAVDPRIPLLQRGRVGEWLFCQDLFDDAFAASNPYYRDLLIPYGGRYSACAKLAETEDDVILVGFLSKGSQPPWEPRHRDYFKRIGTHLQEALALHRKLKAVVQHGAVGANLIERLPRPIAVVDDGRRVTAMNGRFRKLLDDGSVFTGGRLLKCTDPQFERTLAGTMQEMAAVPRPEERRARVLPLEKRCLPLFAVSLALLVPDETLHAFGHTAQYMVTVHERPTAPHHDVSLWQAAFNLSPAEAKVAAHLFGGRAPKEIAKALHVSPSTIKTHLDALFSKTGTSRQAELVRVLSMVE